MRLDFSLAFLLIIIFLVLLSSITIVAAQPSSNFTVNCDRQLTKSHYKYCIVGGGPAGIQLAYFLHRYGLDYVVLERNSGPGSFFWTYPRQRKLISINKVYTGTNDTEFNLRHDWNSLLNGDDDYFFPSKQQQQRNEQQAEEPLLFKNFSRQYYPDAGTIPVYLESFLTKYSDLNVVFNIDVARIQREKRQQQQQQEHENKKQRLFHLFLHKKQQEQEEQQQDAAVDHLTCQVLVMATGKSVERRFTLKEGTKLVTPYSEAPTDPEAYTNQEILILGAGNSAFELARSVESHTALVHIASRNPIQMAHQTHYVGDVRAVNLGFLDRYQLKSMDVLMTLSTPDVRHGRLYFNKTAGRIMLRQSAGNPEEEGMSDRDKERMEHIKEEQRKMTTTTDGPAVTGGGEDERPDFLTGAGTGTGAMVGGTAASKSADEELESQDEVESKLRKDMHQDTGADEKLIAEAGKELFPSRRGYHRVISCLGFKWNATPFAPPVVVGKKALANHAASCGAGGGAGNDENSGKCAQLDFMRKLEEKQREARETLEQVRPISDPGDSFLEVASNFESVNVADLFVVGALAHFRDFKRSAGGFIHGFRYTARTLAAQLRERYEAPATAVAGDADTKKVAAASTTTAFSSRQFEYPFVPCWSRWEVLERMMYRLKNVSSLYQMQGQLADVVLDNSNSNANKNSDPQQQQLAAEDRHNAPYWYFQDIPLDQVRSRHPQLVNINALKSSDAHYITMSLEFAKDFQGVGTLHHQGQQETYKRQAEKMLWDHAAPMADPDFRIHKHRAAFFELPQQQQQQQREQITNGAEKSQSGTVAKQAQQLPKDDTEILPPLEKVTAADLMKRDEERRFRKGGGAQIAAAAARNGQLAGASARANSGYMPASPGKTSLLNPLHMPPQMLPPKDGKPPRLDKFLFLHPVVREYKRSELSSSPFPTVKNQLLRELRLHEDVLNDFTGRWYHREPLKGFLERVLKTA